ncbi:MAG: SUMF1/EgtB/PvdO family nonheme iron enzyme, partial [Thiotrichales bacterium]|nr:SUMF1/EgtB/PvdO family nonheme iron enzyme [Thiotrichales bacterium]
LFDPGKPGALTPAYASLEMLEGEEPDTRDDTYALGCVAYELFTGKHPFNKLPANTARENGLIPAPIKVLNKRQNKAIRRALAFKREDRSQTVDEFIEQLEDRYIWYKSPLTIAAILFVVIGLGSIAPVLNYMERQEIQSVIADINTNDPSTIAARLAEIQSMDTANQLTITTEAKDAIQKYFSDQISREIDTSNDQYSFLQANETLKEVERIYPDTKFLSDQIAAVASSRKLILSDLYTRFTTALKDPNLIDESKNILLTIKDRIDPNHPLLADPRPSNAYRLLAEDAFEAGDLDGALALVASGLQTAPDDKLLQDSKTRIEKAKRIAGLRQELETVEAQLASLDDVKAHEAAIKELASLAPDEYVLSNISNTTRALATAQLDTILQTGSRSDAENMAAEYGELMSALQLGRELSQIKLAHLSGAERLAAIQEIVDADVSNIEQLIAAPELSNPEWESRLLANVQELDSLAAEDSGIAPRLDGLRNTIANLYSTEANRILAEERYDAATDIVVQGERFAPGNAELQGTKQSIAGAKAEFERKIRVAGLKDDFKAQTEANKIAEAQNIFDQLKADLPADDPYITTEAPALLSKSYEALAQSRFEAKDFEGALKLADAGIALNPENATLNSVRTEYAVEAYIVEVGKQFKNNISLNVGEIKPKVDLIKSSPKSGAFLQESIDTLVSRITSLEATDQNAAAGLAQAAAQILPGTALEPLAERIKQQPWPGVAGANAAIAAGNLSQASQLQQEAAAEFSGHPDFITFSESLSTKMQEANTAYESYLAAKETALSGESKKERFNELRQTKKLLARAQGMWLDNPDFDTEESVLDDLINKNKEEKIIRREQSIEEMAAATEAATGTGEAAAPVEWKPVSSGRECEQRLAGYGKRAKAICYDLVNTGWRGPLMVVVPSGEGVATNFAISKYEISVNDWSKYCALTGRCKPVKDQERQNDPITGITLQQAQDYAAWLSERTGKNYRLPTPTEWEYAANAGGKQPKKDFNCRVALGEKVIKGTGTVSIKSGKSNGWGLKNYVGNVQEWVVDGSSATARGGAYSDPHSKCDISLQRPHDGGADESTGFRILLEEVG